MKKRLTAGAIIALCFAAGISVYAAEKGMEGKGNWVGFVQLFSEDVLYLEKEINNLMAECGKELN